MQGNGDYISRDALLSATEGYNWKEGLKTVLKRIPAADVRPRWISVEERLPETRDNYLALTAECEIYICDFIPSVKQWWTVSCDDLYVIGITHWMPLPEPPKEE